jgi:AcrR family transcriptional regulator
VVEKTNYVFVFSTSLRGLGNRLYDILHSQVEGRRATQAGPRERMIVSTAVLVRERGARATSLDAILAHSGAPRGSVYHHFPGGREELLREATAYAGEYVARKLERAGGEGPLAALDALFDEYRRNLSATDFRAGCPVLAVAIESAEGAPDLRDCALAAFDRWRRAIASLLERAGIEAGRADELAMQAVASFEGAIVLSRAYRDLEPLERAQRELHRVIDAELAQSRGAR